MGGGAWDPKTYNTTSSSLRSAYGTTFEHDHLVRTGHRAAGVHETLDPKLVNKNGDRAGKNIREALDSDEHPESLPIAVFFDETGSMRSIPGTLQTKLKELHGIIMRKGFVEHPQILFGAIGDARYNESAPLQVGQFESDNASDDNLNNLFLEGMGGGGNHESYELALYFMARHTYLDSYEKRNQRGYLFIIGDERVYSNVLAKNVKDIIGDSLQEDLKTEDIMEELKEMFNVFFLFAKEGSYEEGDVIDPKRASRYGASADASYWGDLLGQNVIVLEDASAVCETIAGILGMYEAGLTADEASEAIEEVTGSTNATKAAGKALATVGGGNGGGIAKASGELPDLGGSDSTERL